MSRRWSVRNLQTIGILGLWLMVAFVLAGGCAANREPQPIELGKLSDAHKSSIGTINLDNISDVDLVEDIAKLRADYKRLLQLLRQWYLDNRWNYSG